jgi:hypothetical protein
MAFCPHYKAKVPVFGSVYDRECTATGRGIEDDKAQVTCQGDYSKCLDYQRKSKR